MVGCVLVFVLWRSYIPSYIWIRLLMDVSADIFAPPVNATLLVAVAVVRLFVRALLTP